MYAEGTCMLKTDSESYRSEIHKTTTPEILDPLEDIDLMIY